VADTLMFFKLYGRRYFIPFPLVPNLPNDIITFILIFYSPPFEWHNNLYQHKSTAFLLQPAIH